MGCTSSSNQPKQNAPVKHSHVKERKEIVKLPSDAKLSLETNESNTNGHTERGGETNLGVLMAVSRLQRKARRMKALKVAQKEQQWKLFADLDTQDEAEMLHLAVFMQTLIDSVPTPIKLGSPDVRKNSLDDDEDFEPLELTSINITEKKSSFHRMEDCLEYDIESNKIDAAVCEEIVNCYRKGGKLTRKSIVKILRRAYKILQKLPNMTSITVPEGCKLTVVGDLHGQFNDLLYILDESGLPNINNKFIFNGDFVDRGDKGLEIVIILFAYIIAEGTDVICLNRGNHEDLPVCRVYGFENEVKHKYDELLFEMFAEVFNYLPLFSIINNSVFVVHGGLFHTPNVELSELEEIQRFDYYVKPPVPYPQNIKGLNAEDSRKEFMKQLQRDALWSDPTDELGCYLNPRGAGVSFGPDIAKSFMKKNNIDMVVRSHECVYSGFDLPYEQKAHPFSHNFSYTPATTSTSSTEPPLLCTLFSASNYIGGDNEGAFLMYVNHKFTNSLPVGGNSTLHYTVKRYKTSKNTELEIENNNQMSLRELILKRKGALSSAFEAADTENTGQVSRIIWADIMQRITMIKIRWLSIIETIAPLECLSPMYVNYRQFLDNFTIANKLNNNNDNNSVEVQGTGSVVTGQTTIANLEKANKQNAVGCMDEMYGQRLKLETVFYFFDSNGDGVRAILYYIDII